MQAAKWMIRQEQLLLLGSYLRILKQRDTCLIEKNAPMTEITSQKPTRIKSDKMKRKQSDENESVRQMNTTGGWEGGRRGYQVKLHLEFSLFPLEHWLKLVCVWGGGAVGQKDQRQLKVRIKIIRTAFNRRIMHALLFL